MAAVVRAQVHAGELEMIRAVATPLLLVALIMPWSAAASTRPAKTQAMPELTVAAVLARAGVTNEAARLRDVIGETTVPVDAYAARRAAIRACHAERYAVARENVLTGRAVPLRSC